MDTRKMREQLLDIYRDRDRNEKEQEALSKIILGLESYLFLHPLSDEEARELVRVMKLETKNSLENNLLVDEEVGVR